MIINDGKGRGLDASVSVTNRLNVSAKTNPRIFYNSRDKGLSFSITSIDANAVAGDYIAYIKNDSTTRNMFIHIVHLGSANAALWKIWSVTGTAAGSNSLTPANLNLGSGLTAEATSRGDGAITGLATDKLIKAMRTGDAGHEHAEFNDAVILTTGTAIAVEYDTGTTGAAEITFDFHYEDIGAT